MKELEARARPEDLLCRLAEGEELFALGYRGGSGGGQLLPALLRAVATPSRARCCRGRTGAPTWRPGARQC